MLVKMKLLYNIYNLCVMSLHHFNLQSLSHECTRHFNLQSLKKPVDNLPACLPHASHEWHVSLNIPVQIKSDPFIINKYTQAHYFYQ